MGHFRRNAKEMGVHIKQTEPHSPWQNAAELAIRELKKGAGCKAARAKSPKKLWDHALELESYIYSNTATAHPELDGQVPEMIMSGQTADISPFAALGWYQWIKYYDMVDRIPSTTPGAEPPRDAKDSGSARSHSKHLETSSSDRPKMVTYMESHTVPSYMSVKCTQRTLSMPRLTRATHAQPSLSNFPRRDSNFGERTHSRGTSQLEQNFPTSPKNKKTKLTHCSIYVPMRTISTLHTK